ncbi:MAG: adenylate/guanylate cyclase domain-containing protein [Rhodospirillales bacterium]|nr:adenylate/guanylate cyclase domain-containing protein [Rhodospirillaceae bacterium]MBT6363394.1 adenylate/guanylate cyclase domain-containing protein [Rhodospirillaceae bacterium]MBT8002810.1 adenylate/guanylate cyclase domain-containing protein [Rhodospirillales bacterium]
MIRKRVRLFTGLVMATFVVLHLINASLGIASIPAMEAMRRVLVTVWGSPPGMILLMGSFVTHITLALNSLYNRSHLNLPTWEWIRILLGFSIPALAAGHIVGTRIAMAVLDIEVNYPGTIAFLYGKGWAFVLRQSTLIFVAWGHMAIGIHFWLRIRPWYPKAVVILYPLAVLIPIMALAGYLRGTSDMAARLAADPGLPSVLFAGYRASPVELRAALSGLDFKLMGLVFGLLALVLVARIVRHAYRSRRGTFSVTYPSGVTAIMPLGHCILDVSRIKGIPHASVCGGRGRCSTCRVRIMDGLDDLPPPDKDELAVLERIGASPDTRLACQTRPRRDVRIIPLLPPTTGPREAMRPGGVTGKEIKVVMLFADLRGSTKLGERNLPYDVVFILNEFFAEMAAALSDTNGRYTQFNGDGLMALYGLEGSFEDGCRNAVAGAVEMFRRIEDLNRRFAGELEEPLAMGIGIHGGDAIVGTMGPPATPILSAIGDNVNIAARLEAETKKLGMPLVMSDVIVQAAGLDEQGLTKTAASLKGRDETVSIFATAEPFKINL